TQLGAVFGELDEAGIRPLALLSIAKDKESSKGLSLDKIYSIGADDSTKVLKMDKDTLNFFKMIRDETHRFAISYHRDLRGRSALKS
ncbi:MAG TPA: hypothetical protein PK443_05670, partial [bacterium]|nr:hypothetical protein [bacterium]